MSDADTAYQIAEKRIAQAKKTGARALSLSPHFAEDGSFNYDNTPELSALDRILPAIADLTDLQTLYLTGTKVEDISHLAGMTAMQVLSLDGTKVEDISHLAGMTAMQELTLNDTEVEDISPLAGMTAMRTLTLDGTKVEDISPLAGMTAMQGLGLNNTKVADISHLADMTAMQRLYLSGTKADLHQLVAEGAAWAEEDRVLQDLAFRGTPATQSGECLEDAYDANDDDEARTKAALAALRVERDRRGVPEIAPAPAHGHIFLSYSRSDTAIAKTLRKTLESDGVTIWQDVDMAIGKRFRPEIDARIDGAAGVLTLWSEASVTSDYVISEAERGRLADKLVPAQLSPAPLPPPFDGFTTADLSGWSGGKGHAEYRRLLSSLRALLTPDAPVGVTADEAGALDVEMQPIGAPVADSREDKRAEALRNQSRLAGMLAAEAPHANAHPRLGPRLQMYLEELQHADPLWATLSGVFAGIAPHLEDEALDIGLKAMAGHVVAGHKALEPFFAKKDAPDDPDWPDLPPDESDAAAGALREAAEAVEAGPFGAALPDFLRGEANVIEEAAEEALLGPAAEDRARKDGGRAVYVALGVLSTAAGAILAAAGSASSVAAYLATDAGRGLLAVLGAAWQTLMKLVGLM